jgi:hypothetical protein
LATYDELAKSREILFEIGKIALTTAIFLAWEYEHDEDGQVAMLVSLALAAAASVCPCRRAWRRFAATRSRRYSPRGPGLTRVKCASLSSPMGDSI